MRDAEIDKLNVLLHYDPKTGEVRWRRWRAPNAQAGQVAGHVDISGYRTIKIGPKHYRTARLAFAFMTGRWPTQIDHRNRKKDDDRWDNLREATGTQNQWNRGLQSNNTSGYRGVSWSQQDQRWRAHIKFKGRKKQLGSFRTVEAAAEAHRAAMAVFAQRFDPAWPSYLD